MKLIIKEIEIKGFKPYKEVTRFEFKDYNAIEADNGQGKTSLGDAICYAFLGTGADGVENAGAKLLNKESKDMHVTVVFDVDGTNHILTRMRRGAKVTIILNESTVDQVDLMRFIQQKELFLAIFNPMYFTGLTPKLQKELLQKYLGEVSFDDVIKKMGKEGQALLDDSFMVPQLYIDRKREELKEIDSRESYLNGFIVAKEEMAPIPEKQEFTKHDEIEKLTIELKGIESQPQQLHDVSIVSEQYKTLCNRMSELSTRKVKLENDIPVFDEEMKLSKEKTEREKLLNNHKNLKQQLEIIKTVTCPNCGTEVESAPGLKQQIEQQLNEIVLKGKYKAHLIKQLEDTVKAKHEDSRLNRQEQLDQITLEMSSLQQQLDVMNIRQLQSNNEAHQRKLFENKQSIEFKINALEQEQRQVAIHNSSIDVMIEHQHESKLKINEARNEISTFDSLRETLKEDIQRAIKFNSMKLKLQGDHIAKYLNKVNIQFEKVVKSTGEVKSDFKIQYEGRDFNLLSTSERIKAGIEVGNLLMKFSECTYPVFIDNAESITEIPQIDSQVIVASVIKGKAIRS